MPKVGGKHFDYSPAGEKAAEREAVKTGKRVVRRGKAKAKPVDPTLPTVSVTKRKVYRR